MREGRKERPKCLTIKMIRSSPFLLGHKSVYGGELKKKNKKNPTRFIYSAAKAPLVTHIYINKFHLNGTKLRKAFTIWR